MSNNKWRKVLVAAMAFMVIATGCAQKDGKDANKGDDKPPVTEQQTAPNEGDNTGAGETDADGDANPEEQQPKEGDGESEQTNDEGSESEHKDDDPILSEGEVSVAAIIEKLSSKIELDAFMELDAQQVEDMYGIDPEALLQDWKFMPAMMNISSHEITVVQLKSEEHYDEVAAAMEQRAQQIQKIFETYLPDQYEASKNYQIVRHGDFVLFTISHVQEEVKEIFDGFFAG